MVADWKTLDVEELLGSPIFRIERVRREHPEIGEADFFAMSLPDWVNVVALTADDEVVAMLATWENWRASGPWPRSPGSRRKRPVAG